MPWTSAQTEYWASGDTWGVSAAPVGAFSSTTVETTITGYLESLYASSPTAKAVMDKAVSTGGTLKIGEATGRPKRRAC